ncbi:MAG: type II secretion system protein GspM [Bryobacteraceae bacterium]
MTVSSRDRRALILLGAVVALTAVYIAVSSRPPEVVSATGSIPLAEKRLGRLRQIIATVPGRQKTLDALAADTALREKNLLNADTAPQAQAQLLQVVRRLCGNQAPPLEVRNVELGPVRPYGEDYGEALVTVGFEARVEQLVNLLTDLTALPELVASEELRVTAADQKQKTMHVRLTVSGVVLRRLVPQQKGFGRL